MVRRYSELIPEVETPVDGLYLCTMAQVYPEDRGTNYAIREGREVAALHGSDQSKHISSSIGK